MAFYEVRLPVDIEKNAQGGHRFDVTILELNSGFEQRNLNSGLSRGEWDVSYGVQTQSDWERVLDMWYTMRGPTHGFRFKDWSNFRIGEAGSPQSIGTGDGSTATFQAIRTHTVTGALAYSHTVKKLVAGSVSVYIAGVLDGSAVVNVATGVVTPTVIPTLGQDVAIVAEFDYPVRFNLERLDVDMVQFANDGMALSVPRIPLKELRIA